ncbi:sentrin-specific protease 1, partial [Silurus meridionalis]
MFNKFCEWIESGIATLRNEVPAAQDPSDGVRSDRRKRPLEGLEDGDVVDYEADRAVKKFRMGDFMDTMKNAAEGMKTHGSSVALWMRDSVSPTLRNMLPASPGPPRTQIASPDAANSSGSLIERRDETHKDIFVAPATSFEWKTIVKSDSSRTEESVSILKVGKRHAHASLPPHETHKTNGHPVSTCTAKPCSVPRLGRPLYVRAQRSPSQLSTPGTSMRNTSYTSMYEKTFPIRVVQNPSPGSSSHHWRGRTHCTAQESVRKEEKEVYRQLLAIVSGGQSSFFSDSLSNPGIRSHRDFSSFLTSSRRLLQCTSPEGSGTGESFLGLSSLSPSPQTSSAMHSPCAHTNGPETQPWDPDSDAKYVSRKMGLVEHSVPSPAALQDTSSQDTQSSAHDGDSVIFVKEQHGKRTESSSVPCFQAELWIKELTSLYDARARERRRLIDEQEALTSQLLYQRLSGEGRADLKSVELRVRVPLEKEVPLTPVIVEPENEAKEQEFPELTEAMENEVSQALRGINQDEVLSEGFRQTITRKDLQTLSNLNWLNDEVKFIYIYLLVERSKLPRLPSVYTFNTFFFPKLRSSGYSTVRRWTKKVDIFSVDIILVPVHLGVHWCLSVVDFRKKTITYFDSMGGSNDEACQILLKYLKQECEDKKKQAFDTSNWILHSKKRNEIPQQMNGSDCGMFTCKYAEYITKDKPITFTQKHMPYFRRRMVWEILNRKLL